ncbi:MAG TPA: hypothetical protein VE548_06895 [Nitrososphaeraceae archaeon]|nr:hypothetical protein [Nitrososphaeraceae archaeon]
MITHYDKLYDQAQDLFHSFKSKTHLDIEMASKELFIIRVRNFASEKPPDSGDEALMAQYLLPKIVADNTSIKIMQEIMKFVGL